MDSRSPSGWLVAYLTVLLIVAEPLRNAGKYTMADVLAYRLRPRPVRAMAALSTLTVSTFYMIAQMIGAGTLVALLLKGSGITYNWAVVIVGVLMVSYVVFGGMLATTWVQIIKAVLLMGGTIILSILVMAHFHFSFAAFFDAIAHVKDGNQTVNFLNPGLRYKPPYGPLDLISLGLALIFGTAGLPHILVRFYTVPDAKTARISVVWAMVIIGSFYIMTTFLGFGAATIVGKDFIAHNGGTNMSAPLLAQNLGGDIFFAFISAIAFATILAVVAGLTISASTSFAHDFWDNVVHHTVTESRSVRAYGTHHGLRGGGDCDHAFAIGLSTFNVAFLVALAFAVAASANLPVIVLLALLETVHHGRRCLGAGNRAGQLAAPDRDQPQHHGDRCANGRESGTPPDPDAPLVPAGESGHRQHSTRIRRSVLRNDHQPCRQSGGI